MSRGAGLTFTPGTRTLSGTPTTAGSYRMTYRVADADDNGAASDGDARTFTITVQAPESLDTSAEFHGSGNRPDLHGGGGD